MLKVFPFVLTLFCISCATAQNISQLPSHSCEQIFANSPIYHRLTNAEVNELASELKIDSSGLSFFIPTEIKSSTAQGIVDLARLLIRETFSEQLGYEVHKIILLRMPNWSNQTGFFEIKVQFKSNNEDQPTLHSSENIFITNGQSMFHAANVGLFQSVTQPQVRKFRYTFKKSGMILFGDQGLAILETFPKQVRMSRSMSENERGAWLSGTSAHNLAHNRLYKNRLYFSYKHFKFNVDPYHFYISKEDLLQLYSENLLEINTYDLNGYSYFSALDGKLKYMSAGISENGLTPNGLGVEIVFFWEESFERLRRMMVDGLLQGTNSN